ncbi:MAG: 23S ribosomal RNA methyltransferase [Candidatus Tokpelaia hoelldobleri]|uniref:23S ribosomal RNA methyltransferase n=1 Tax=Candidatus Tokpelaia hoelldobleri TaxID=1902579 RepID=A0A1U9JTJ4_9HYPH|nr:MAG: 23S ribosomal RNA methyltransferase [Candidatus Tokpelaia hoelldoblerii]
MQFVAVERADQAEIAAYRHIRERDLAGRHGLFVAEGKVVLSVLLRARVFSAQSLLVVENRLPGLMPLLEETKPACPVYVASQAVMDEIAGFHVHRGILGIGCKTARPGVADFLAGLPEEALLVVLCGITNHDNIGAIFRNAAAFAADGVLLDETCCDPLYRKSIRVSVGAALKVPYTQDGPVLSLLDALESHDFSVMALSPSAPLDIYHQPRPKKLALLLGTEGEGLPEPVLKRLQTLRIPIAADFDSLNVATAAAIALSHFTRLEH